MFEISCQLLNWLLKMLVQNISPKRSSNVIKSFRIVWENWLARVCVYVCFGMSGRIGKRVLCLSADICVNCIFSLLSLFLISIESRILSLDISLWNYIFVLVFGNVRDGFSVDQKFVKVTWKRANVVGNRNRNASENPFVKWRAPDKTSPPNSSILKNISRSLSLCVQEKPTQFEWYKMLPFPFSVFDGGASLNMQCRHILENVEKLQINTLYVTHVLCMFIHILCSRRSPQQTTATTTKKYTIRARTQLKHCLPQYHWIRSTKCHFHDILVELFTISFLLSLSMFRSLSHIFSLWAQ